VLRIYLSVAEEVALNRAAGFSKLLAFPPRTVIITLTIKNAPTDMTKPIMAKVIFLLAAESFSGSPEDMIH
jgi:hypothetical protein